MPSAAKPRAAKGGAKADKRERGGSKRTTAKRTDRARARAKESADPPVEETLEAAPSRFDGEIAALVLLLAAGFVEVSLYTYTAADSPWGIVWVDSPIQATSPSQAGLGAVANACGPVGALVALGLMGGFGHAAHLFPFMFLRAAWHRLRFGARRFSLLGAVAWLSLLAMLAGSLETFSQGVPGLLPEDPGGELGQLLSEALIGGFHIVGTQMILGLGLVLSFLLATGLSLREGMLGTGRALGRTRLALRGRLEAARDQRALRRERKAQERLERAQQADAEAAAAERGTEARTRSAVGGAPESGEPRAPVIRKPLVIEARKEPRSKARQVPLPLEPNTSQGPYQLPPVELLAEGPSGGPSFDRDSLIENSKILEQKLADFGVLGTVVKVHPGPVITMYEFEPAPGIKVSRIVNLADDLALALRALSVRIVAPLPGKNVVGVEVPNANRETVVFRDLLGHESYTDQESKLTIALGKDIFGSPVTADLKRMPHLLVAGATGSGKSVFLNALLLSIFYKADPSQVKLLLIDPKMLEFAMFQGIPHLIAEVVTNSKRAAAALLGIVRKMEERYQLMSELGVRNIDQYNRHIEREPGKTAADGTKHERLPYIVVVIDELADLMIVAARDVEESLMRLAQMARAAGIHLVLATQRPSVDVLTGVIKANFPSRLAFQVSSRTDSRTVLDGNGAERLLGQGDSLFLPPGTSRLERIHGPYVSDKEVAAVTEFLRSQGQPEFDEELIRLKEESERREDRGEEADELLDQAIQIVASQRIASISFIQRKLKIGYNRAARLVEHMEAEGIIGPQEGTKPREIFVRPPDEEDL